MTENDKESDSTREGYVRADAPIERRSEDRLHRTKLAEAIADQIIHGPTKQGFVIGVAGRWGSGKTSLLKMTEEVVRERSPNLPILHFNPWLFSGSEQLVSRFLQELGAQLRDQGNKLDQEDLREMGDRLVTYAQALEPFGWLPFVGSTLARIGGLGRGLKKLRDAQREQPSAEKQRDDIRSELAKKDRRVLVVIDDLDRVEPSQIRDMVRLVKLVGDFPNTTYLVSYDRRPVEQALATDVEDGRTYLEKIIQVVHDLPDPPPEALLRMLTEELDEVLALVPGTFNRRDWINLLPSGLRLFFQTPRAIRRYLNTIAVSLRVLDGEVALVDALALEAIQVFAPESYELLPLAVGALTGENRSLGGPSSHQGDQEQVQRVVEAAGKFKEPVREILSKLFPQAGQYLGGTQLSGGEQRYRRELRVASPEVFRTYLQRTLPPGVISGALVNAAATSLSDPARLQELFDALDPDSSELLIQRLEDYEGEYDPAAVEPVLPVLINQLPRLREGTRGMADFGASLVVGRVVLRLLRRVEDEGDRLAIIERALPQITQLSGKKELIDTAGHRESVGHKLITEEASARLYADLNKTILEASPETLAQERELARVFALPIEADRKSALARLKEVAADDAVMIRLLRSGLSEQRSQTMGEYAVQSRPALPWELFIEWFGEDELKARIKELSDRVNRNALDQRSKEALDAAERYSSGELSNDERMRDSSWSDE
jgi:predicted KAP-like P-loop ATPase